MTLTKGRCFNFIISFLFLFSVFAEAKSILPSVLLPLAAAFAAKTASSCDKKCEAWQTCSNGVCKDNAGVCNGSWDCDGGKSCINGKCAGGPAVVCSGSWDCDNGKSCINGTCAQ